MGDRARHRIWRHERGGAQIARRPGESQQGAGKRRQRPGNRQTYAGIAQGDERIHADDGARGDEKPAVAQSAARQPDADFAPERSQPDAERDREPGPFRLARRSPPDAERTAAHDGQPARRPAHAAAPGRGQPDEPGAG